MDERFNQIMIVFKYIDDKDIFQKFYTKFFANRLIKDTYASEDAEENMINKLKGKNLNSLERSWWGFQISAATNTHQNYIECSKIFQFQKIWTKNINKNAMKVAITLQLISGTNFIAVHKLF